MCARKTQVLAPHCDPNASLLLTPASIIHSVDLRIRLKPAGVLQCDPKAIVQSSPEAIVNAANLVDAFDSIPLPPAIRNNGDKVIFFALAYLVYNRLQECAGASCGFS